jgi:hypothetical protein
MKGEDIASIVAEVGGRVIFDVDPVKLAYD